MTTRDCYRIGSALSLAFVFGSPFANAQVGAPAPSGQVGSTAPDASRGDLSRSDSDADQPSDLNAKKASPAPRPRVAPFNRVTTTRTEGVPAQSRGASPGAVAASRPGQSRSMTPSADARMKSANTGIPAGSTARQEPKKSTRSRATAARSVTHNYYPTLRPGLHLNANKAQVANGARGRNTSQGGVGVGMGMGLGIGKAGSKAAQTARPSPGSAAAGGGSGAAASGRR